MYSVEEIDIIYNKLKRNLGNTSLLNDIIFKHLLGEPNESEERLINFINAIRKQTNQSLIQKIEIHNSTNFPKYRNEKITFLDIKAQDEYLNWYNIEVQLLNQDFFVSRVIYYNARLHASQLNSGEYYSQIRPTISIILVDFELFSCLKTPFQTFRLTSETDPNIILSNDIQFHFIQLAGNWSEQKSDEMVKELVDWLFFFNFSKTSEVKMKTVLFENSVISQSADVLSKFVADDEKRFLIEEEEKARRDYFGIMQTQFRLGELEGKLEGKIEGKLEGKLEGKFEGLAEGVIKALQTRFPFLSNEIQEKIKQINDLQLLNSLLVEAITCQSLDDFIAKLS